MDVCKKVDVARLQKLIVQGIVLGGIQIDAGHLKVSLNPLD
jgi:hypothetical protein